MANYNCAIRTNYFHVADEKRFRDCLLYTSPGTRGWTMMGTLAQCSVSTEGITWGMRFRSRLRSI